MPLHPVHFQEALELLTKMAKGDRPSYAVTANVDHVVRYRRCPSLRHLYQEADLCVADGTPVIWASRIVGRPLPERVTGSDLFPALCARAAEENLSVFFLGGSPGAAEAAAEVLKRKHPALRVAGTYCPPFGFEKDAAKCARSVELVHKARPDILFVGLGSPKQEEWIAKHRDRCGAKLSVGIGISFSFVAGHVKRAPRWLQRLGLEWFHRLIQEPGRLWKRYLWTDLGFLFLVFAAGIRRLFGWGRGAHTGNQRS